MRALVERWDGWVARRRALVLAAWLLALVVATPFALRQDEHLTAGGYVVPGSQSEAVERAAEDIPGAEPNALALVLRLEPGADARAALAAARREVAAVDGLALAPGEERARERRVRGERVLVVPLDAPADQDRAIDAAVDLGERLDALDAVGARAYLAGHPALWAGVQQRSQEDLVAAEAVGFPIVLLILVATFGSLAAATLPLGVGIAAVTLTGAVVHLLSRSLEMSLFVTNIASLIGIGVAVDYSLFVLARYRQELRAGADPAAARRRALATSGVAVAFSGATVIVALAGLFLIDAPTLRSMALGAIVVVAFAVLATLALLPALLAVLGRRLAQRGRLARRLARRRAAAGREAGDGWARWAAAVMRRPALAAGASAALMALLAAPALSLDTGAGALRQLDRDDPERAGTELAAAALGAGALAPFELLVELRDGTGAVATRHALGAYARALARDPAVARVAAVHRAPDGRALVTVIPRGDPEGPEAEALLARLRDPANRPAALRAAGARVDVGGATAQNEDFRALVADSLWKVLLFVAVLSYLVLLVLLRSVLLPLKAVAMNLLSVGAAYGAIVAVFQWGWFDGLGGFESPGYVNDITPAFVVPIVFGLSMDYEIFLLARIRERHRLTGDTTRAVADGLRASAGTITSAALIMVAVFATFVAVSVPSVKELGVGLSVAIALDATLVRLVLAPAAMALMGRWNWWLPRPLERLLGEPAPQTP